MHWKQELGESIERARRKKAWTQEKLAVEAGFHTNTIGFYERGVRVPDFDQLRRLAEVLEQDHFKAGPEIRIEFGSNGRPSSDPLAEQLLLEFDEKNGVSVRIESAGRGITIIKMLA